MESRGGLCFVSPCLQGHWPVVLPAWEPPEPGQVLPQAWEPPAKLPQAGQLAVLRAVGPPEPVVLQALGPPEPVVLQAWELPEELPEA